MNPVDCLPPISSNSGSFNKDIEEEKLDQPIEIKIPKQPQLLNNKFPLSPNEFYQLLTKYLLSSNIAICYIFGE